MTRAAAAGALTIAVLAIGLSGCAARDYASPVDLQKAFAEASGTCADPQDVPSSMVGEGTQSILCPDTVTMIVVFDDEAGRDDYVASALSEGTEAVVGGRWVVLGPGVGEFAGALGGTVQK